MRREDSGLQAERTLLAWQRTCVLLAVVALLYLRDPFQEGRLADSGEPLYRTATVLVLMVVLGVLIAHLRRRWRQTGHGLRDDATGRPPAPVARPWAQWLLCAATTVLTMAVAASAAVMM